MENAANDGTTGREMDQQNVKAFCTCEGAVVAVPGKPENEKREFSVTETEVLGSDFGVSIRRSDFEVKWDSFHDPDSPRSIAAARKWLVICILASVSLCSWVLLCHLPHTS